MVNKKQSFCISAREISRIKHLNLHFMFSKCSSFFAYAIKMSFALQWYMFSFFTRSDKNIVLLKWLDRWQISTEQITLSRQHALTDAKLVTRHVLKYVSPAWWLKKHFEQPWWYLFILYDQPHIKHQPLISIIMLQRDLKSAKKRMRF